jgi:hypothetical protein
VDFGVDKDVLLKKLKRFAKVNCLVRSRCVLLSTFSKDMILYYLNSVSFSLSSMVSCLYNDGLSKVQTAALEKILDGFVLCYERITLRDEIAVSSTKHADFCATIYATMFAIAWTKRDYTSLYVLFELPQRMSSESAALSTSLSSSQSDNQAIAQFVQALHNLPDFYRKFKAEVRKLQQEDEMDRKIREEEEAAASGRGVRSRMPVSMTPLTTPRSSILKRSNNSTPPSPGTSAMLGMLKNEHDGLLLEASLVSKFAFFLSAFIDSKYVFWLESTDPETGQADKKKKRYRYSLPA